MVKKSMTIGETMNLGNKCKYLSIPYTKNMDLFFELKNNKLTVKLTTNTNNFFDITDLIEIDLSTTIDNAKDIVTESIINKFLFNNNDFVLKKDTNVINNYDELMYVANQLIPRYAEVTKDYDLEKLDSEVYKFVEKVVEETKRNSYPMETYKEYDDIEIINNLKNKLLKQINEYLDN